MGRGLLIWSFVLLVGLVFFPSQARAGCAAGKFQLHIITTSGQQKAICLPEATRQAIENAVEHADKAVVSAECPCWRDGEIAAMMQEHPEFRCKNLTNGGSACYIGSDITEQVLDTAPLNGETFYCANNYGGTYVKETNLSKEQFAACKAAL